jgi:predicted PurR-regulated permease PerM
MRRLPGHPRVCALVTTGLILLMVVLPLTFLGWNAYNELRDFTPRDAHPDVATEAIVASTTTENTTVKAPDPQKDVVNLDVTSPAAGNAKAPETADQKAFMERLKEGALHLRDKLERATTITIENEEVLGMVRTAQSYMAAKVISGLQSALKVLIGLAIMVIALYYFFADGPVMIRAVMQLSPLDPAYEQELLKRFGDVSRAVVVATLLAAVYQGSMAGIGYSFALPQGAPVFLLTVLTMVTALVPFVGAAAMWICVSGWIYFYGERVVDGKILHDGNPSTAIILAIYCLVVVSLLDNIIKPFILHGQSKLHPLLALLSILGGLQALGPVGILVGPMLVSFLQALLEMLRKELESFGGEQAGELAAVIDPSKGGEIALPGAAGTIAAAVVAPQDGNSTAGDKTSPAASKRGFSRRAKRKR